MQWTAHTSSVMTSIGTWEKRKQWAACGEIKQGKTVQKTYRKPLQTLKQRKNLAMVIKNMPPSPMTHTFPKWPFLADSEKV